jgi:hypothetical protein
MNFTLYRQRNLNGLRVQIAESITGQETLESGCFVVSAGRTMLNMELLIQ